MGILSFEPFPKIARLCREVIVTEKIDGTNAQVIVSDDGVSIGAASRSRLITPDADNFGFARWVQDHREELLALGPGRHFGEWYGAGIQRGYGLREKRFALFNVERWDTDRPGCCDVVPTLYRGAFDTAAINGVFEDLRSLGSYASPGFMRPEGIIVYHTAGRVGFKRTFEKDDEGKSASALKARQAAS